MTALSLTRPALALLALGTLTPLSAPAAAQVKAQSLIVNPAGPSVSSVTLINADTDQPVPGFDPIPPAATLDLSRLPRNLSLRANTVGTVGSVRFGLDRNANYHQENNAPFALCGDRGTGNDYTACPANVFTPGTHQITVTPYTAADGKGTAGTGLLLNLTVVRPAAQTPAPAPAKGPVVTSLTLIDADTDKPVPGYDPIPAGARLRLSALPRHLNVRANVASGVGSVRFNLGNGKTVLENEAPFAMCVDGRFSNGKKGNYYTCDASVFSLGDHRVTATAFSQMFGKGQSGAALVWNYTVER